MSLADELERLERLRASGTLTDTEFVRAKEAVLSAGAAATPYGSPSTAAHLEALRQQNAVEQLDREWQMEREQYMVRGKYGTRYTPNKGMAVGMGIVSVGFGAFWMFMALGVTGAGSQMPVPGGFGGAFLVFPLFGVLFILAAVFMAVDTYRKAVAYEAAEAAYRRRRAALLMAQAQR